MKNIHILPTDYKYSRLYFNINDKEFQICEIEKQSTLLKPNRHIYITSDEDINENDYIITKDGRLVEVSYLLSKDLQGASKIILTTDPRLAPDVQKIDDEFLEWFVKNPSCEEVDTYDIKTVGYEYDGYAIIIPEEEAAQEPTDNQTLYKETYSKEDMIRASKYGYNFHKITSFPELDFEDSCIRNTQQWLTVFKKK